MLGYLAVKEQKMKLGLVDRY